jgi:hypothetical protein
MRTALAVLGIVSVAIVGWATFISLVRLICSTAI